MSACALCGSPAPPVYRPPAAEMAPDLDFRPGEPAHSTLGRWVAQCRGCGACAPDLAALPPGAAAIVETPQYRATRSRFLRWASLVAGTAVEPQALLQAAWEADDRGEDATDLRRRAATAWGQPGDNESALQLVDILRRAGDFAQAADRLNPLLQAPDDGTRRIAAFQQTRVAAQDTGRHLISSALRPPARTPHVTHGRAAPGFWGKLFGSAAR